MDLCVRRLTELLEGEATPGDGNSKKSTLSWHEITSELMRIVNAGDRVMSEQMLTAFRKRFPLPAADILRKEIWGTHTDELVVKTHARMDISYAIKNIERTGRTVSDKDKMDLEMLCSHWCAWSPSLEEHRNEPWIQFLRYAYDDLIGLQPVLDSLIWPEEIAVYPLGYIPPPPSLFLLATSTKFYVYNYHEIAMLEAGCTLADVIEGMRREGYWGKAGWRELPCNKEEDPWDYFPVYDNVPHTAESHKMIIQVKELAMKGPK